MKNKRLEQIKRLLRKEPDPAVINELNEMINNYNSILLQRGKEPIKKLLIKKN